MGDGPVRPMTSFARPSVSEADDQMGAAFGTSATAMFVLDPDMRVVTANRSASSLLDRSRESLIGARWEALSHPDEVAAHATLLRKALAGRTGRYEVETRLTRPRDEHVWCRVTGTRVSIGSHDLVLVEVVDITGERDLAEKAANAEERIQFTTTAFQEELRRLAIAATTDQGTGLKNRRGFFALAQHEMNLAQRLSHPLTLIFFDLDELKEINDTLGHLEGDRAIADAARLLSSTFRESDLVARLGGDEFCVLALGPPKGFAQTMARFESALDRHNRTADRPYRLSLSYGVAFFDPTDGPVSLDELVSEADASMYESKLKRRSA